MSAINAVLVLLLVAAGCLASVRPRPGIGLPPCPRNEHYTGCFQDDYKCMNPTVQHRLSCVKSFQKCNCLPNFYRHGKVCVPANVCPRFNPAFKPVVLDTLESCKAGEYWYGCHREEKHCDGKKVVSEQCERGCFCEIGYVRSKTLGCVYPNQCPKNEQPIRKH
uniref:TIL domain-containing protein n=1 Tax=Panagrellus redivivus TaxID=6233 RepID=A0A7E4VHX2_PANRE